MGFFGQRTIKYGSNALTAIVLALGILAAINFLTMRYYARFDLTERGLHTLSDQTVSLLSNLDNDLTVVAFYREAGRAQYEPLLKQYAYHSRGFSYRFVDPDKEPMETRRYMVARDRVSVIEYGNKEERIFDNTEMALTNAIARVTGGAQHIVYFVGGHDEPHIDDPSERGFRQVKQHLINGNFDVRPPLVLAQMQQVPRDCQLLIVAGPKTAFFPAEVDAIGAYLNEGGAAIFLLDPLVDTGLEPVLRKWGVGVRNDFIVDQSNVLPGADFSVPVTADYGRHPITERHSGLMTFFPLVRSMERLSVQPGSEVVPLVISSPRSWGETNLNALTQRRPDDIVYTAGEDTPGPLWMGMAVLGPPVLARDAPTDRRQPRTRLVVFGDSDFITNQFVDVAGNGDLFMNAANWLVDVRDRITIRTRQARFRPLEMSPDDAFWIQWVYWLALPALPILAGVIVWWRRR